MSVDQWVKQRRSDGKETQRPLATYSAKWGASEGKPWQEE